MIKIDGKSLTIEDVIDVAQHSKKVEIDPQALPAIKKSRDFVEKILKENRIVYGITTGVGELANQLISAEDSEKMQQNLIFRL